MLVLVQERAKKWGGEQRRGGEARAAAWHVSDDQEEFEKNEGGLLCAYAEGRLAD